MVEYETVDLVARVRFSLAALFLWGKMTIPLHPAREPKVAYAVFHVGEGSMRGIFELVFQGDDPHFKVRSDWGMSGTLESVVDSIRRAFRHTAGELGVSGGPRILDYKEVPVLVWGVRTYPKYMGAVALYSQEAIDELRSALAQPKPL